MFEGENKGTKREKSLMAALKAVTDISHNFSFITDSSFMKTNENSQACAVRKSFVSSTADNSI